MNFELGKRLSIFQLSVNRICSTFVSEIINLKKTIYFQ